MMVFKFFGEEEEKEDSENFVELDASSEQKKKVGVRIEDLQDYKDVDVVQRLVREGFIVFLRIKGLRDKNLGELKRAVAKLRKGSVSMGGDIVGVDENFLVLTPEFAKVERGTPEEIKF